MVEVPQSLFYPFYQPTEGMAPSSDNTSHAHSNGLLSPPPPPPRVTRTAASGVPNGTTVNGSSSNGTASSLLAAVAVQAHAHGGQQGAPDMYITEERLVQSNGHAHPMPGGYVALGPAAYHGHPQYSLPPPPPPGHQPQPTSQQHPPSHIHHAPVNGAYAIHGGHPMPPTHGWVAHNGHTSTSRANGYAVQPSS